MTCSEAIAALTAVVYYRKVKDSLYRFFAIYLIVILGCETLGMFIPYTAVPKHLFFNYFVIPLEFIFFFWLYGYLSLKNKKLFYGFAAIYVLSFIPNELYFLKNKYIFSFNYTFGCLLLMILVILEYYKQINSENILNFTKNRMFYINIGVTLFYIGTLPLWTFYLQLYWEHRYFWDLYINYFRISAIIMYFLFASSFIWGKQNYS